ncbi:DeoR/GlpR family DNA-binding transcription regulator [Microbacterium thalassium]|uniref:Lactose phosphotransferase system repressor n=1 Tax=Microbacterium thalassium TaxID=362649 RepID=A0A7X0KVG8_9MICO|nr:DeoR/GlpR family DNA-binding transcription regulator [Microbacterium thalassium]MBB6392178.1 DeoR family fructose operon transcriptional repressor [Microbacterium thalassium]GLK23389.1 D-beta-D-heptose 1-phosphate adenosyltransferase [Microbacterium thalassium]
MYATERQQLIERMLRDSGRVSVIDLAQRLEVTTETIRRDLGVLETSGLLRRVHGGAVPADRASTVEPTLAERLSVHGPAKDAIARRAAEAVPAGFRGSVFFDAGSTTAAVAEMLAARLRVGGVEVVTHSIAIAADLAATPGVALTVVGGRVRGVTAAAVGAGAVRTIEMLRPDIAFVGTNGVSADFGLSTPDPDEAAVKRAIVAAARRVVVVAAADKLGDDLLVSFAGLDDIDVLVTDAQPDADLASALDDAGVEVWLA